MRSMLTVNEVRSALGPELLVEVPGLAAGFDAVTNDSRVARPGELFVALVTEARDGHAFVNDAIEHGVTAVLVDREIAVPEGVSVFRVTDTRHALGQLARSWRDRF